MQKINEKITVIVPIYNIEQYLPRCLESIMQQTYQNLEIICVDDGSTDNCPHICDVYADKDARVKVIHKENKGLAEARNTGLDMATAEYVMHVDGDDYIHSQMIEELMDSLAETNADIVYCNYQKVFLDQHVEDEFVYDTPRHKIKVYSNVEALGNLFNELGLQTVASWGKIYKKSLFEGIRYPAGMIHEDEFITYKLLYRSKKIAYVDTKFYCYAQRTDSIMGQFRLERLVVLDALKERTSFFKAKEFNVLYIKSLRYYLLQIAECYVQAKEAKMSMDVLGPLKKRFNLAFKSLTIRETIWLLQPRFKIPLFYISPNLYEKILLLKRKYRNKNQKIANRTGK